MIKAVLTLLFRCELLIIVLDLLSKDIDVPFLGLLHEVVHAECCKIVRHPSGELLGKTRAVQTRLSVDNGLYQGHCKIVEAVRFPAEAAWIISVFVLQRGELIEQVGSSDPRGNDQVFQECNAFLRQQRGEVDGSQMLALFSGSEARPVRTFSRLAAVVQSNTHPEHISTGLMHCVPQVVHRWPAQVGLEGQDYLHIP